MLVNLNFLLILPEEKSTTRKKIDKILGKSEALFKTKPKNFSLNLNKSDIFMALKSLFNTSFMCEMCANTASHLSRLIERHLRRLKLCRLMLDRIAVS